MWKRQITGYLRFQQVSQVAFCERDIPTHSICQLILTLNFLPHVDEVSFIHLLHPQQPAPGLCVSLDCSFQYVQSVPSAVNVSCFYMQYENFIFIYPNLLFKMYPYINNKYSSVAAFVFLFCVWCWELGPLGSKSCQSQALPLSLSLSICRRLQSLKTSSTTQSEDSLGYIRPCSKKRGSQEIANWIKCLLVEAKPPEFYHRVHVKVEGEN